MSQQAENSKVLWILVAIISMSVSGGLLWYSQKTIPIGIAYAVWTGLGTVGTLIIGIIFFGDSASIYRLLSASLIVIGIIGLKIAQ
jgi:quaternary ammonium compound-resistance protein SugE